MMLETFQLWGVRDPTGPCFVQPGPMWTVRKSTAARLGKRTRQLAPHLARALTDIEAGRVAGYRWAAWSQEDAERILRMPRVEQSPTSLAEYEAQQLHRAFPSAPLAIECFTGFALVAHPALGRGGPVEHSPFLQRKAWPDVATFGSRGLVLARTLPGRVYHSAETRSLLARALQEPGDDTVRAVLADALLEDGDPRGEAILAGLDGREAHGIEAFHSPSWLGSLAQSVHTASFRLGFAQSATFGPVPEALVGDPTWRTLEEVVFTAEHPPAVLRDLPLLRSARGVRLPAEVPPTVENLDAHLLDWAHLQGRSWPHLRTLVLRTNGLPPPTRWSLDTPRLEHLTVDQDSWCRALQHLRVPFTRSVCSERRWNRTFTGSDHLLLHVDDAFSDDPIGSVEVALEGMDLPRLGSIEVSFPHAVVRPPIWASARLRLAALCPGATLTLT